MNVTELLTALQHEFASRPYFSRLDVLDQSANPHVHDTSAEGRRAVSVSEFLNEIESVLANMGLP